MARRRKVKIDNTLVFIVFITAGFYHIVTILSNISIIVWLIIGIGIVGILVTIRNLRQQKEQQMREERCKELERKGNLNRLRKMSSRQFEFYIRDLFKEMGYEAYVTPQVSDGGKDIMIYKDNYFAIAECKRFGKGTKVTRPQIQKFHSAIIDCKAEEGYFITTGEITEPAASYVLDKPIILVNGSKLIEMIEEVTKNLENENEVSIPVN